MSACFKFSTTSLQLDPNGLPVGRSAACRQNLELLSKQVGTLRQEARKAFEL